MDGECPRVLFEPVPVTSKPAAMVMAAPLIPRDGFTNPSLSDSLASVLITDLNGNGQDDILRWVATSEITGRWEVSWDGRTVWQSLAPVAWPITDQFEYPAYRL